MNTSISSKTSRVLNIILLALLLILLRVWYLSVIQRDEHLQKARKPQRRTVIEQVERATIRDRFNVPLALNQIHYHAAICYAQIRQIPSSTWKRDESGKKIRIPTRANYIADLSKKMGEELGINPLHIEDLIHGKAALFPHTPFVIKEDLTEEQYYRLKMLEKEWVGLQTERSSKRVYPKGKVGCDVIGHLGSISQKHYYQIASEMRELRAYLAKRETGETTVIPKGFNSPIEVRERLKQLEEKAYTINALVGKSGVEAAFDEELRGVYGKKVYEVDTKGNIIRELPGSREAIPGQRILLSISAELQEYAEALLAHNELGEPGPNEPWIQGGSIVAIDPKTGEILALASSPRIDPNDFIPNSKHNKNSEILRWLEHENHVGEIWDGKRPLEKEVFSLTKNQFYNEQKPLSWELYLDTILPTQHPARLALNKIGTIKAAFEIQEAAEIVFSREAPHQDESAQQLLEFYLGHIPSPADKLLVIDLCRLFIKEKSFSPELLSAVGTQTLSTYRTHHQALSSIRSSIRKEVKELFHELDFTRWRETHFKEVLKEKRKEEKEQRHYARPYTEYLEQIEKQLFKEFWQTHKWAFFSACVLQEKPPCIPSLEPYFAKILASHKTSPALDLLKTHLNTLPPDLALSYLKTLRPFEDLSRPLLGKYPRLRNIKGKQLEKHLASAFYPTSGFGYGRSLAFRQTTPQGSVFKLVTGYEAMRQRFANHPSDVNPLTLVDDMRSGSGSTKQILGRFLNGQTIHRLYKGGILPRAHPNIGEIDLPSALEQSSNIYFSILAGDFMSQPTDLCDAARLFGFGEPSGIELPGEIGGNIPNDVSHNRTGLYSFAIGQHSLVVTPLQTSLMLSTIANGGHLLKPQIVKASASKTPEDSARIFSATNYPFKEDLALAGIFFPLFTEATKAPQKTAVSRSQQTIRRSLFLPEQMRDLLFQGMRQVVTKGTARPGLLQGTTPPKLMRDYIDMQHEIIGKTGTAEILYKKTIDSDTKAEMKTHVWFAAVGFDEPLEKNQQDWPEPEIVVVTYLRFRDAGKEGAPIAAQINKKWREIRVKHQE
jgi:cell division protein FtsI/penicillin-binding protein 2